MGRWTWIGALALGACGGRAEGVTATGGGGSPAQAGSTAAMGGSPATSTGGSDTAGEAGELEPARFDINGRWGLFQFEDPVGVDIELTGATIGGNACDVGAPPTPPESQSGPELCGALSGTLAGQHAQFGFHFQTYDYLADVTVSSDGQRMTGRFHGTSQWLPWPTAWLRVADDEQWLTAPPGPVPATEIYTLRLTDADGDEYRANEPSRLISSYRGMVSALGSFWNTEIARSVDGTRIDVGPVPLTEPQLAVSLQVQIVDGQFAEVKAVTGSGHHYAFSATPGYDGR